MSFNKYIVLRFSLIIFSVLIGILPFIFYSYYTPVVDYNNFISSKEFLDNYKYTKSLILNISFLFLFFNSLLIFVFEFIYKFVDFSYMDMLKDIFMDNSFFILLALTFPIIFILSFAVAVIFSLFYLLLKDFVEIIKVSLEEEYNTITENRKRH